MTTHFWAVQKIGIRAIQIDVDPEALGRNYPLAAAVLGDARVTLARMVELADASTAGTRKSWVETTRGICAQWRGKDRPVVESDAGPGRAERGFGGVRRGGPGGAPLGVEPGHPRG